MPPTNVSAQQLTVQRTALGSAGDLRPSSKAETTDLVSSLDIRNIDPGYGSVDGTSDKTQSPRSCRKISEI